MTGNKKLIIKQYMEIYKFVVKAFKRSGALGFVISTVSFVVNETEEVRMSATIKNGDTRTSAPNNYNSKFSQFPMPTQKTFVC